jgi:hypothetical protein
MVFLMRYVRLYSFQLYQQVLVSFRREMTPATRTTTGGTTVTATVARTTIMIGVRTGETIILVTNGGMMQR